MNTYIAKSFFAIVGKSGNKKTKLQATNAWFLECFILSLEEEEFQLWPHHLNSKSFTNWNYFPSLNFKSFYFREFSSSSYYYFLLKFTQRTCFRCNFRLSMKKLYFKRGKLCSRKSKMLFHYFTRQIIKRCLLNVLNTLCFNVQFKRREQLWIFGRHQCKMLIFTPTNKFLF